MWVMVAGHSGRSAGAASGGANLPVPIGQTQMAASGCQGIGMPSFLGAYLGFPAHVSESVSFFFMENDLGNGRW